MKTEKTDHYQAITDKIIAKIEAGVLPWRKTWKGGAAVQPLRSNGERYRGINVLQLWMTAEERGYTNPYWFTFNQAKELGGFVKKGEKGTIVFYASSGSKIVECDNGEELKESYYFLRSYVVFNGDQIEGLPEKYATKETIETPSEYNRYEEAEQFFAATGAKISHGGGRAYYSPSLDSIQMPELTSFESAEAYYGTLAHEVIHWTGHESRLNREGGKKFGDDAYAFEELVAELGAVFVCADLAIEAEQLENHAAYVGSWLKILKADKRAIFQAASAAAKAAEFLSGGKSVETESELVNR